MYKLQYVNFSTNCKRLRVCAKRSNATGANRQITRDRDLMTHGFTPRMFNIFISLFLFTLLFTRPFFKTQYYLIPHNTFALVHTGTPLTLPDDDSRHTTRVLHSNSRNSMRHYLYHANFSYYCTQYLIHNNYYYHINVIHYNS